MPLDLKKVREIMKESEIVTNAATLKQRYSEPIIGKSTEIPSMAVFPTSVGQISKLMKYLRTVKDINVLCISSQTNPKFLDDTAPLANSVIIDLTKMRQIPLIDKRNRVCVVEPGVTWSELVKALKEAGLRPRSIFLPREGKSVLASILDREPHLCPKAQFDISDPLLCMEVVFGNGEVFRTGEAAGPRSMEENRQAGAALKNPLGPGQTDIFRLVQGSKGTYGCCTWISMQCEFIPTKRIIRFINQDNIEPLTEFIYATVRRRLVDEIFIINENLYKAIFPSSEGDLKQFTLIYAINGYEWLPDEKVEYQREDCNEILREIGLETSDSLANIQSEKLEPLLDGQTVDPHPKYSERTVAVDIFYNTTLDRVKSHIEEVDKLLKSHRFPPERLNIYVQPVIQARATHLEFSLVADRPGFETNSSTMYEKVCNLGREIAEFAVANGGFFSRPYKLVREFSFKGHEVYAEGLRKLKKIFDPDTILNKGELCF